MRGGTLAQAYVYPRGMRETRDLLRRRSFLVRQRALLIAHIQNEASQYNLPAFAKKLSFAANRAELQVADHFADPSVKRSIQADLALIDAYDQQIGDGGAVPGAARQDRRRQHAGAGCARSPASARSWP